MTLDTTGLERAAAAVVARAGTDLAGLPRDELVDLADAVARVRRAGDVVMAQVAAEIDRRSQAADGGAGLAAREGFRSSREMIARATGSSVADAGRLVEAGALLAEAAHPDADEEAAAEQPSPMTQLRREVSNAVRAGRLSVDAASMIARALADLPDAPRTAELFTQVVRKAPGLAAHRVRELVWRAQAAADPEAWARREQRQHDARAATVRDDADGMVTLTARLKPIDAAPVRAVLDAGVRRAMQARRDDPSTDDRTPWQMRADLLVALCRHALDCDAITSGVKTTVVVRMSKADLESGVGVGEVDGCAQPVSVAALRAAAVDAEAILAVLGSAGEVLDWGRARRLFTPAQRLALVERDGGCAWCHAPPSWCEAHHIRWWERDAGPTDLSNGVLLCTRCHHRIHRDGWVIRVEEGRVMFTPPRSMDTARTPVVGGRERYDIAA